MSRRFDGLRLIALLKFGKALLLIAAIYGAYRALDPALADTLQRWSETLTDRFERNLALRLVDWLDRLSQTSIDGVLVVTGLYTALVVLEGTGLWLRKRWGEWITVVSTSTLIPFEIWKLAQARNGHRLLLAGVLVVNVAIVLYLYRELRRKRSN